MFVFYNVVIFKNNIDLLENVMIIEHHTCDTLYVNLRECLLYV